MISKNIISIGMECEGGMNEAPLHNFRDYIQKSTWKIKFSESSDGSVTVGERECSNREFKFYSDSMVDIENFLNDLYSRGFLSNHTCGFHVHVKPSNFEVARSVFSMRKANNMFFHEYKKRYGTNPKYMARLKNSYCLANYNEEVVKNQLESDNKASRRYFAVNLNALNLYGTLEFRIFPHQCSVKECMSTLTWLINTYDSIMDRFRNEKLFNGKIFINDDKIEEVITDNRIQIPEFTTITFRGETNV